MGVTYRHGISILQLCIYFPAFFLSVFIVARHGFAQSSGFIWLLLFTLTRIVGSCCDLATINNFSQGLFIASAVCSSIGLSPLMLTCTGLLSRANESTERKTSKPVLSNYTFHFYRIFTVVALALSIAGITANMSAEGLMNPDIKTKVGMILYVVAWALLVLILLALARHSGSIEKGERRSLVAVAISAPFILVRVLYALFVWFLHDSMFSLMNGNVTVQLIMAVLEEFAVVIVCLGIGLTLQVRGKVTQSDRDQTGYKP